MTEEKKSRGPSLWINAIVLVLLFAVILISRETSKRLTQKPLFTPEDLETQIVMEDLENQTPMIESEPVNPPVIEPQAVEAPKPPAPKVAVKPVKKKSRPSYNQFTDNGPEDLDRKENWDKYFPEDHRAQVIIRESISGTVPEAKEKKTLEAKPTGLKERDQFIPFDTEE